MLRRAALFMTCVLVATALAPAAGFAWVNGRDSLDDAQWGTHDWVVWQAYVQAGQPVWFRIDEALLNNDDPDTLDPDRLDHIYHVRSGYGGAPYRIGELYSEAVRAYKAGDMGAATRAVGLLSHYYADTCQPLHTASRRERPEYGAMHFPYEMAIRPSFQLKTQTETVVPRARRAFSNVRDFTIAAAGVSNSKLATLVAGWSAGGVDHPGVRYASATCLNQAVNGLADIIAAVPSGAGQAPAATRFSYFKPYRRYVAKDRYARADARLLDAKGRGVRGIRVEFVWSLASTGSVDVRYTDRNGYAHSWRHTGTQPYFTPFTVLARTVSGGRSFDTGTTRLMTTPVLKTGRAGFSSKVSNKSPRRETTVTASAVCVSKSGRPVAGLRVKFTWKHRSGSVITYGVSDAKGVARSSRNIGRCSVPYRVDVRASTQAGGSNRSRVASFWPRR